MLYSFDKYHFFIQQLVVTLMFILLFWFRTSFLNVGNLLSVEDKNYLLSKEDNDWTDFIFAFNSFFSRNYEKLGLRKKTVYVTNRLGSGKGKEGMYHAILNGFKHHPRKTVGAGTGVLVALAAKEGLLYKQNTDQHAATLAAQQEEQVRNFLSKALSQAEESEKNAYDCLERALKSRDKDFIASAKDRVVRAEQHHRELNLIHRERFGHDSLDLKVEVVDLDFKPKCPFEPTSILDYLAFIF